MYYQEVPLSRCKPYVCPVPSQGRYCYSQFMEKETESKSSDSLAGVFFSLDLIAYLQNEIISFLFYTFLSLQECSLVHPFIVQIFVEFLFMSGYVLFIICKNTFHLSTPIPLLISFPSPGIYVFLIQASKSCLSLRDWMSPSLRSLFHYFNQKCDLGAPFLGHLK